MNALEVKEINDIYAVRSLLYILACKYFPCAQLEEIVRECTAEKLRDESADSPHAPWLHRLAMNILKER